MPFYLAVDNGGTKTDYALADETRVLAKVRSRTIKRMRTDAAAAEAHLEEALAALTAQSGVSMRDVACTCIGTAGEKVALVTDWLRAEFSRRVGGELILLGDVEIALDAAFREGAGVLVLAGTGSNVAGRTRTGVMARAGGWGPALADQGSGHRIGLEALRAGFLALDEGNATPLLEDVQAFWKLRDLDELVAYANQVPAPDFSQLTALVVARASAGDRVAAGVLAREGEALGYLVRLVLRRLVAADAVATDTAEVPRVAFAGSIMEKVPAVRTALLASVRTEFAQVEEIAGIVDPLEGALWRARRG